jgi:signal peptidase II
VFALWLFADLWTKDWADTTLANPNHPLPFTITAADSGKTLSQAAAAHFGWSEAEASKRLERGDGRRKVTRLAAAGTWKADDKPFGPEGIERAAGSLWVFWRDDRGLAPRRIPLSARRELESLLADAVPEAKREEIAKVVNETAAAETLAGILPEQFRKLDADEVATLLAEGRVHPVPIGDPDPSAATVVKEGETYLLMDHRVDVMGEWWKFVYAENPGAAFGFMKGVSPGIRQTFFMLLTLIAFIVIGTIVARLPARGWLVASSFAGILAGAAGNFIDRVRYGYVIDFIDWDLGFTHWPTFNVADIAIAVGVGALMFDLLFNKKSLLATPKKEKAAA